MERKKKYLVQACAGKLSPGSSVDWQLNEFCFQANKNRAVVSRKGDAGNVGVAVGGPQADHLSSFVGAGVDDVDIGYVFGINQQIQGPIAELDAARRIAGFAGLGGAQFGNRLVCCGIVHLHLAILAADGKSVGRRLPCTSQSGLGGD